MGDNQLICGLRRRYAKTLGMIHIGEDRVDDLAHLGSVIRMFAPDTDLVAIKPIRPYRIDRSKYLKDALSVLRQANGPMTPRAIARRILCARGVALTRQNLQRVECSLHAVLERLEGCGVLREEGSPKLWRAESAASTDPH